MPIRKRITGDDGPTRWWCVEMKGQGQNTGRRVFVDRVEATEKQVRAAFGPYVDVNPVNGEVYVWAKPRQVSNLPFVRRSALR